MLAFDSPWWIVSAISLTAALRVWMANLIRLPRWVSWVLAALVVVTGLWRLQAWMQMPAMPISRNLMLLLIALAAAAVLYLFDYDRAQRHKPGIIELIDSALIALLLVFCILRPFVVQAFFIPSESMLDTLRIDDRILVNKFIYFFREPRHNDIVVFRAPPQADPGKKDFIKRVIGLPGDRISVHDQRLWRNGQPVEEKYIREAPLYNWPVLGRDQLPPGALADPAQGGREWVTDENGMRVTVGEVLVPKGAILVMGDNRNDSNDSHAWTLSTPDGLISAPFVPRENVLGEAEVIFWPLWRIRYLHWKPAA